MSHVTVRLRELRHRRQISQRELAHRTGLRRATIIDIEKGRVVPHLDTLERLASALGVKVRELLI